MIVKPLEQYMIDIIYFHDQDEQLKSHLRAALDNPNARIFVAIEGDYIIGVAGIWKAMYVFGEWGLWLTDECKKRKFDLIRHCYNLIDDVAKELGIHTLIALVDVNSPTNQRFIEFMDYRRMMNKTIFEGGIECHVYERMVI